MRLFDLQIHKVFFYIEVPIYVSKIDWSTTTKKKLIDWINSIHSMFFSLLLLIQIRLMIIDWLKICNIFFCKDMKGDREKEKIINLNYHFIKEYEWKMFDRIKCSPNNQRFVCLCVCVFVMFVIIFLLLDYYHFIRLWQIGMRVKRNQS